MIYTKNIYIYLKSRLLTIIQNTHIEKEKKKRFKKYRQSDNKKKYPEIMPKMPLDVYVKKKKCIRNQTMVIFFFDFGTIKKEDQYRDDEKGERIRE